MPIVKLTNDIQVHKDTTPGFGVFRCRTTTITLDSDEFVDVEAEDVDIAWTCSGGSFTSGSSGNNVSWLPPTSPGVITIGCAISDKNTSVAHGSRDDQNDITLSRVVRVYGFTIEFSDDAIAAGGLNGTPHQTQIIVTATDGTNPVAGVGIGTVQLATPLGSRDSEALPTINMSQSVTGQDGISRGTFTSGNYEGGATIKLLPPGYQSSPPGYEATIAQNWNENDDPWIIEPEFVYDEADEISYTFLVSKGEGMVPVDGHAISFRNLSFKGLMWDEDAGEDWDEDGNPDGEYVPVEVERGVSSPAAFGAWDVLSTYGAVTNGSPGVYQGTNTVHYNPDFLVDVVKIQAVDGTVYGEVAGPDGTSPGQHG